MQKKNMPNSRKTPFHIELFSYLLNDLENKIPEDAAIEESLKEIKNHLQNAISLNNVSHFPEILDKYQHLVSQTKKDLKQTPIQETLLMREYLGKISRGLPRLYNRYNPTQSFVKKDFSDLGVLKKLADEKTLLPRFEKFPIPKEAKVCLFTYMLPDGWGDLIAVKEVFQILKARFPHLHLKTILCVPKAFSLETKNLHLNATIIPYDKDCPPSVFPKEALSEMKSSHLILSLPTFYPYTGLLKKELKITSAERNKSKMICIGQYGFLESSYFHPRSGNYSMGLHFLEKGILIRENSLKPDFRRLENQTLLFTLFGTTAPQIVDVERYLASNRFYLAYLLSPFGGAIYLHALLQSQIHSQMTIDICTPHIGWLVEYLQICDREKKPVLAEDFGIREMEIHFGGKIHRRALKPHGKKLRILCPGNLSDADFRNLIRLSEEFVAVRGDQSFSEAVSANRIFFYDGAPHARYFMKDLIALAENRLNLNKAALAIFRCMNQAYMYNRADSDSEWVEETYFQEKQPWQEIAKKLGSALQSPSALSGFQQFNQIIRNEYSFNKTLCHMVQRELSY